METWARCVKYYKECFTFHIFYINNNNLTTSFSELYRSDTADTTGGGNSFALRPIVEIDFNVGLTGTGADGDGYSLTLK